MKREIRPFNPPPGHIIAFFLSLVIVLLCMTSMTDYPRLRTGWWLFFIVANIGYIVFGLKRGWVKPDPGNGLVIATGPVAFFGWTAILAWRKYISERRKPMEKQLTVSVARTPGHLEHRESKR